MSDKFDFEEELADSIAQIIDEETAEAENLYRKNSSSGKNRQILKPETDNTDRIPVSKGKSLSPKAKLIIIIGSILAVIGIVVAAAVIFINYTLKKSKDNYGYYQNLAYQAKDNDLDYSKAVDYFNKAFNYKDSLLEKVTVSINGMDVKALDIYIKDMLNLRDCYANLGMKEEEVNILNTILEYDPVNENAVYYLVELYDSDKNYTGLYNLYLSVSSHEDAGSKVLGFFRKYKSDIPVIAPAQGDYYTEQEISFLEEEDCKIYYTTDGTAPEENASLYTQKFTISEGSTTIKYYKVNQYGFASDVSTAEYNISFEAPAAPKISKESGSYETSSEIPIAIGNIPANAKAYYEISYTDSYIKPTQSSNVYTEPFPMPEGNSILSVVIIDERGMSSDMVINNYYLKKTDRYSDSSAEQLIWSTLVYKEIINDKHKTEDGKLLELSFYSKKEIDGKNLWMFNVKIADEKQKYYYGCDADTGNVYRISKNDDDTWKLKELKYY